MLFCKQIGTLLFELARQILRRRFIEALVFVIISMRAQQPFVAPGLNDAGNDIESFGYLVEREQTRVAQALTGL